MRCTNVGKQQSATDNAVGPATENELSAKRLYVRGAV